MATRAYTLRQLLLGKGVWDARDPAADAAELDRHLYALATLLPKVYGGSGACKQAVLETTRVAEMGCSAAEVAAKRAMLLVGLAYEPSLELYWQGRDSLLSSFDKCGRRRKGSLSVVAGLTPPVRNAKGFSLTIRTSGRRRDGAECSLHTNCIGFLCS